MVEGDIFREVEQDMRRERLNRAWASYGVYILTTAALIIVGVAGYNGWKWWQEKRAAETGAAFLAAAELGQDGKKDEMTAAFRKIAADAPRGYAALAKIRLATAAAEAGKLDEAAAQFASIAADSFADKQIKDFARVQWAALQVDKLAAAEIRKQLEPLNVPGNHWRHSARELLGLAAFKSGDASQAERLFQDIAADQEAPAELRKRAQTMLALLVKTGQPGAAQNKEPVKDDAKTQ